MVEKLTENAKDRPYSKWSKNETIIKATSRGLKNSGREMESEEVLQNEKRQRSRFNEWVSSWTEK